METSPGILDTRFSRRRIDRAAETFSTADFVHRAACDGLLERLAPVSINPELIVDAGSATGKGSATLAKRFRRARIVSLDQSLPMLRHCRKRRSLFSKSRELQGDATRLPFQADCVDMVFANLLLPWLDEPSRFMQEVARVLRPGGVFAFSALGPDSLRELRDAWREVDSDWHVRLFPDMHIFGDALMGAGLADPVLDVDKLKISYEENKNLYRDLTGCGARSSLAQRRKSLTGKGRFARMESALSAAAAGGPVTMTMELVYGHAWGAEPRQGGGEVRVDPGTIGLRQR